MEVKITVTLGELMDECDWMEACKLLGLNDWCLNEGLAMRKDTIDLTQEQAEKLGLINKEYMHG